MGIFDCVTIDSLSFPHPGMEFQAYFDIDDTYGDFYHVDETGQLHRLTMAACMGRDPKYVLAAPALLDYTDPALEVYGGELGKYAYLLTFERGRLINWRINENA